jgi:hypothetical protein
MKAFDRVMGVNIDSSVQHSRSNALRASQPTLLVAGRVITTSRDAMVAEWTQRLGDRLAASPTVGRDHLVRQFGLLVELIGGTVGPFRREVVPLWNRAMELYGRTASLRGLAAGEVVEELQHLREILTVHLAPELARMRQRQAMAVILRLNRIFDRGLAVAVVGYTDALVATIFAQNGVPPADAHQDVADIERQTAALAEELAFVTRRH